MSDIEAVPEMPDLLPMPELPELGELLTADFDGGYVVRPGDVLLLGAAGSVTNQQMQLVRDHLRERLPKLADVIVLGGLTIQGVFRDEDDHDDA